jgi:hypothetical protein
MRLSSSWLVGGDGLFRFDENSGDVDDEDDAV